MILQKSVVMELLPAAMLAALCCVLVGAAMAARAGEGQRVLLHWNVWKGRSIWLWLLPFFVCAGMLRAQQAEQVCSQELLLGLDGRIVKVQGTVAEAARKDKWMILVLENGAVQSASGGKELGGLRRIQVYVDGEKAENLPKDRAEYLTGKLPPIGSRVEVRGECALFETARNPGEFDYQMYYRSLKLNYRMFATSFELVDRSRGSVWDRYQDGLCRISLWASDRLEALMDKEDAGVFRAVLLGDKSGLSENIRDMYQKNGIAHLLAVSGLHLSLVSLAVYGILRRLGAGYGAAGLVGGAVLLSYGVMTGASPSVIRALIMVLCGFLAAYLGRTYDLLSALGLSALWLLWDSPYLVFQAGVQLSFGAIIGIGGLTPCLLRNSGEQKQPELLEAQSHIGNAAKQGFLISVSMQLVTLPLILFHFFQFPLYGIFLNLLVVPLMGVVLASGSAGIAFGSLSLAAGRFAAGSGCAVLGWYAWCCGMFERLPGSSVILGRPRLWQIGVYYGILAAAAWIGGCGGVGRKTPLAEHKRGADTTVGRESCSSAGCKPDAVFPLLLMFLFVVLLPLPVRGLNVTFLDVGQGDGICIQTNRAVVMVDGGSSDQKNLGEMRIEPFLKSSGIRAVDYWIVSHGDQDHISGLIWLLEESGDLAVGNLVLPAAGYGNAAYERLLRLAEDRGTTVSWMERADTLQLGELQFLCIYPEETAAHPMPSFADRNEHSLVLRADYGGFSMLLTGDMSGDGEKRLMERLAKDGEPDELRDIQVLKVAHHGSRFSSTKGWLAKIRPAWAVVSYGEDNRYGHPSNEMRETLQEQSVRLWETAESGAVQLWTDGKRMRWKETVCAGYGLVK